ncbi:MAG TPA: hypothetical protein VIC32_03360, partial [Terriglobales bacterium]
DLLMRLHDAVGQLDTNLNRAIDARDALEKSGGNQAAVDRLNRDIDEYVDLKIQSSEGGLVYPGRLRAWLTAIAGQVDMAFVPPTPAMIKVANDYIQQANAGVAKLQADIAAANQH